MTCSSQPVSFITAPVHLKWGWEPDIPETAFFETPHPNTHYSTHTHTQLFYVSGFCPGQPG